MGGKIVGAETLHQGRHRLPRAADRASSEPQPEAIYVPGYYTDVGLIARQARELGIKVPLLGGDGWDSREAVRARRQRGGGQLLLQPLLAGRPGPRVQKFVADYKAAYGAVPDALAALGYDAAKVAVDAHEARAQLRPGTAIRDAIAADQGLPGRRGHHHPGREAQRGEARGRPQGRRRQVEVRRHHQPARCRDSSSTSSTGSPPGTIYALVALGYTMVYGVLKLINFAHGDVMMVGVYLGYARGLRAGPADAAVLALGRAAHLPGGDGRRARCWASSSSASPTGRCARSRGSPRSSPPSASPSRSPTASSWTSALAARAPRPRAFPEIIAPTRVARSSATGTWSSGTGR